MEIDLISNSCQTAGLAVSDPLREALGDVWDDFLDIVYQSTGVVLVVGEVAFSHSVSLEVDPTLQFRMKDGFRFFLREDGVRVEAGAPAGLRNALYWLLREQLGCRWFWPGKSGEFIPRASRFSIPLGPREVVPDYEWRWLGPGGPVWEAQGVLEKEIELGVPGSLREELNQWGARNLLGGPKVADGHRFFELADPREIGEAHPDNFALVGGVRQNRFFNGKHGNQLCTSNSKVVEWIAARVNEYFDARPDVEVYSISPNDGGGFCECDECLAQDASQQAQYDAAADAAYIETKQKLPARIITDRMFRFANAVAALVARRHPSRRLLLLVYGPYRAAPVETQLAENVIAQFCCQCSNYSREDAAAADFKLAGEIAKATHYRGIYEYYDQGQWPGIIRLFPNEIEHSIRRFHELGYTFYSPQFSSGFAVQGLNVLTMAHCLWDTRTSAKAVLDDFCRDAFGRAGATMKHYFTAWEERWMQIVAEHAMDTGKTGAPGRDLADFAGFYPKPFLDRRAAELEEALGMVQTSAERERIRFIAKGFRFTELYCKAVRRSLPLKDEGVILSRETESLLSLKEISPEAALWLISRCREALDAWNDVNAFIEAHRGEPVLSHFWVCYHRDSRRKGCPARPIENALRQLQTHFCLN